MNKTLSSFFARVSLVISNLMALLIVVTTLLPINFPTQSIAKNSAVGKSTVKSSNTMRKLPKRPGYRQLA